MPELPVYHMPVGLAQRPDLPGTNAASTSRRIMLNWGGCNIGHFAHIALSEMEDETG